MRDKAKQAKTDFTPRRARLAPALLCLTVLFTTGMLSAAPAGAVDNVPFQGAFCEPTGLGTAPCSPQFTKPQSLAFDSFSGDLYVADVGDEVQSVKVSATAGQFRLKFGGETTNDIAFDFNDSQVEGGLNQLASIDEVGITGGPGNAAGSKPYLVTFVGEQGGSDVEQLQCVDGTTPLSGGSGCSVTTVTQGAPTTVSRFHSNGTAAPFAALGTNAIDGKPGPGGKPCAEEPASCDDMPGGAGIFGIATEARELQVAVAPPGAPGGTAGNVYVTNSSNHRIDVFAADGRYFGQIAKYLSAGSQEEPLGEACGVAVDQSGALYVGDYANGVHKYVPTANPPLAADGVPGFVSPSHVCALAPGAGPTAGFLFVAEWDRRFVRKLSTSNGAEQCGIGEDPQVKGEPAPPARVTTITTDPLGGHLFVVKGPSANSEVAEYDGSCPPEPEVDAPVLAIADLPSEGLGAAFDPVTSHLFVSREDAANVEIFGEPVTLPVAVTLAASAIGETGATLNGTLDPEGTEAQECAFEYLRQSEYEANLKAEVDPFSAAASQICAETPAQIGSGEEPVSVHAEVSGLDAGALYRFRLVAKNAGGTDTGADLSFATRVAPLIADVWVESASDGEATLKAQINPRHYQTSYHVEYGPEGSFDQSTSEVNVGSDDTLHTVTASVGGLKASTTYSWRVVATSENGSTTSEAGTFTTYPAPTAPEACPNQEFRVGPSATLPDCRAYEMVSPIDKNGGDVIPTGGKGYRQASLDGNRLTYTSGIAFGDAVRGAYASQYLATRTAAGWSSHGLNPPQETTVFDVAGVNDLVASPDLENFFHYFSPDLCFALVVDDNYEPLAPDAIHAYTNAYLRDNCGPGADSYEAITRGGPPSSSTLGVDMWLQVRNLTPDRRYVVFSSRAALTEDAASQNDDKGRYQLYIYDFATGELRLVNRLPSGETSSEDNFVGVDIPVLNRAPLVRALADDGSRVFWTGGTPIGAGGSLYVRVNPAEGQSALDGEEHCTEPAKACTLAIFEKAATEEARFWTASPDGSVAIYSVGDELREFDVDKALAGETATNLIADGAGGVVGASDDLSHLYFTSKEAIAGSGQNERGEEAAAGEWNLYLRRDGTASFIVTLASEDRPETLDNEPSIDSPRPALHRSRVSPDGLHLAFMSIRPLTGYDNTDAISGEADSEVFLYDADFGNLSCASCNPSGVRPAGRDLGPNNGAKADERWTAAWIPPWEQPNYAKRSLSDDGSRVFFNALDALVPEDTNGRQDVYQWEAPGTGSCEVGDPSYFAQNEGCVSLISTGKSTEDTVFIDASASGDDVFIQTQSSIDPRDHGLIDIYDARVGGGYPPPPLPGVPCVGDACQSVPSAPNDPTPASSAFRGPGDPKPPAARKSRRCAKGKRKVVNRGKTRCVKRARPKRKANHDRRNAR